MAVWLRHSREQCTIWPLYTASRALDIVAPQKRSFEDCGNKGLEDRWKLRVVLTHGDSRLTTNGIPVSSLVAYTAEVSHVQSSMHMRCPVWHRVLEMTICTKTFENTPRAPAKHAAEITQRCCTCLSLQYSDGSMQYYSSAFSWGMSSGLATSQNVKGWCGACAVCQPPDSRADGRHQAGDGPVAGPGARQHHQMLRLLAGARPSGPSWSST